VKITYANYAKAKDFTCLGAWCLLFGPEQHLKREALARMRAEVMASGGVGAEATWETLEGSEVTARDLIARGQTLGLFGGARGIVVLQAERIGREQQEELAKLVAPLPSEISVILVTGETGDRRRILTAALRKAVETHGLAVECPEMKPREAASWAVSHAKSLGKKLEPAAAQKLASQRVGTGLGELASEVEKLAAYVGDAPAITVSDVDAITPRLIEESVFQLIDAVAARSPGRAVALLRPMLRGGRDESYRVLPLLAQAVREIWQTKLLVEHGWRPGAEMDEETAAMLPADGRRNVLALFARRGWLAGRRITQAQAFSWAQLTRAVLALHSCDLAMKGIAGKIGDEQVALELLVLQLCTDLPMPLWEDRTPVSP